MAAANVNAALVEALDIVGFSTNGVGNNNPARRFLSYIGVVSPADVLYIQAEDMKDSFKNFNRDPDINVRIPQSLEVRTSGFFYWCHDMHKRGIDIHDGHGHIENFDDDVLTKWMAQRVADKSLKESSPDFSTAPKFNPNGDWIRWKDSFGNFCKQIAGAAGCSLYWIIRAKKPLTWDPANDAVDEVERRIYQIERSGPWYDQDCRAIFLLLQNSCRDNVTAWTWIQPHEPTSNGFEAWKDLTECFDGSAEVTRRETEAQNMIKPGKINYRGELRGGEAALAIAQFRQAYAILEASGERVIPETDKVQALYNCINTTNQQLQMERSIIMSTYRNDFDGACRHLATRVIDIFPQAGRIQGAGRRLSSVRRYPDKIDGVNIADLDNISDQEWNRLSPRGRETAKRRRSAIRARSDYHGSNRQTNRDRGGRGRGRGNHNAGRGFGNRSRGGRQFATRGGRHGGRGRPHYQRNSYGRGNHQGYRHNNNNNGGNGNNHNRQVQQANARGRVEADLAAATALVPYNPNPAQAAQGLLALNPGGSSPNTTNQGTNNGNRGGQAGRGFGRGLYQN